MGFGHFGHGYGKVIIAQNFGNQFLFCGLQPALNSLNNHFLGDKPGPVEVTYDTKTQPDHIRVYYRGQLLAETRGPVSGRGSIRFDGATPDQWDADQRGAFLGYLPQTVELLDGSVAQNVAYAHPNGVDRTKVEQCLRAANLWSHVSTMTHGMDTSVGTNGNMLSGGQRQRLAIARALYRDAAIWIFDEATSALDSESEAVVQRSIEDLRGSKTLILIAHRLSTIRNADRIYVMADGRVAEQGDHASLMAQGGIYAGMVRIQSAN